jgi:hypothetical protein
MERHWDTASNHEQSALADEPVLALRQSFCDYLVSARKQRNMSIHEIAGVTRIPVRSLERLESGLFEELPADVFVRGFLRSYARCVGLDVEETIRRYSACGMKPAPVASPMADKLANSMATLHEGGHPSVRQVTAPLPSQAPSDDGIGTSPSYQVQPAAPARRSATEAPIHAGNTSMTGAGEVGPDRSARRSLAAPGHEPVAPAATDGHVKQQLDAAPASGPESVHAQVSTPVQVASATASHDELKPDERPARRKRRRRRRQRREVADAASTIISGVPETRVANAEPVSAEAVDSIPGAPATSEPALVVAPAGEPAAAVRDENSPAAGVPAGEPVRVATKNVSETASQPARVAAAVEHVEARPIVPFPRASTQSSRTHVGGRGRASTVAARPVLVIDDANPEEAERAQEERVERSDSSWRSLLPPALLDSDDGSHRGTLTLAVIILVIVATLTMSYLLRRPNISGDGVTWNATTALDEQRFG